MWGAIGAIGGSIATGLMNRSAASDQEDFQRYMSNTAHRRAAKDLEKAGLNRVLAVGSPASTPAGAMASVPDYGANLAAGISADTTRKQANAAIKETAARTEKARAETGSSQVQKDIDEEGWKWLNEKGNEAYKKSFLGASMAQKAGIPTWGGLVAGNTDILTDNLPPGWGKESNQKTLDSIRKAAAQRKARFEKKDKTGKSERDRFLGNENWIYDPKKRYDGIYR